MESILLEFGKVWWPMVVGRKSIAGGSFATALLPLLSAARALPHYLTTSVRAVLVLQLHMCRTQVCARLFTRTHRTVQCGESQFVIMYLQCAALSGNNGK